MLRSTSSKLVLTCLLLSTLALVPRATAQELASRETLRVLFIGSSYTYYNNLGDIVAAIAAADPVGPIIEPTLAPYAGASSLKTHLENGSTRKLVERGGWDWVVLQETSLLPGGSESGPDGRPVAGPPGEFHASVRTWAEIVRKAGGKPALLMTWPRRLPRPDSGVQPMAKAVADAYLSIGRELNIPVAPVGLAWEETRRRIPALDLHIWDNSHPNQVGSYLTGLVVYSTLTGRNPIGAPGVIYGRPFTTVPAATFGGTIDWRVVDPDVRIPLVDVREATAGELQRIAWKVVNGT